MTSPTRTAAACCLAIGCALMAAATQAAPTPGVALLSIAKDDQRLAIVDPATLQVVARVPVGPDPHEIAVSADGRTAYVSNYAYGRYHTIAVVDLVAQKALPAIDTRPLDGPHGLAIAGGKLWFTSEIAKALGRYDPATRRIDWILGTGQDRTHMLWVAPDESRIIAANVTSGTLSIIDRGPPLLQPLDGPPSPNSAAGGNGGDVAPWTPPTEGWLTTVLAAGAGVEGFDISPDGKTLWAANANAGTISIIDLATRRVLRSFDTGLALANRVKFTPDGKRVLVSQFFGPDVVVYDATTSAVVAKVPAGRGAAGILIEPGGGRAFVALWRDNAIEVIDLKTLTVTGRIATGGQPDGLAWAVRP
jgi:YVTN family beta-propeller protein